MKIIAKQEFNHFPALVGEMRIKANRAIVKTTFDIEGRIKMSMSSPKSGREYPRGSRMHRASAPGEAPAVDYGTLINSITSDFPTDLSGLVFSPVPYSLYLEFGTGRMAARPAWIPAATAAWPGFLAAMSHLVG